MFVSNMGSGFPLGCPPDTPNNTRPCTCGVHHQPQRIPRLPPRQRPCFGAQQRRQQRLAGRAVQQCSGTWRGGRTQAGWEAQQLGQPVERNLRGGMWQPGAVSGSGNLAATCCCDSCSTGLQRSPSQPAVQQCRPLAGPRPLGTHLLQLGAGWRGGPLKAQDVEGR